MVARRILGRTDPHRICFCQDSISSTFRSGTPVVSFMSRFLAGRYRIKVVMKNGALYALNNRTLFAAQFYNKLVEIEIVDEPLDWESRFTNILGCSVQVRGGFRTQSFVWNSRNVGDSADDDGNGGLGGSGGNGNGELGGLFLLIVLAMLIVAILVAAVLCTFLGIRALWDADLEKASSCKEWTHEAPSTKPLLYDTTSPVAKCLVASVAGAIVEGCDIGSFVKNGTICTWVPDSMHTCDDVGASVCIDGNFSISPICAAKCMVPSVGGAYLMDCSVGSLTSNGSRCTWTAMAMHTCMHSGSVLCVNGQFSALPSCVADCAVPLVVGALVQGCESGSMTKNGSTCVWKADSAHSCVNIGSLVCVNGSFSAISTCTANCLVPFVVGASVQRCEPGSMVPNGTACSWKPQAEYSCENVGNSVCNNGAFAPIPHCSSKCSVNNMALSASECSHLQLPFYFDGLPISAESSNHCRLNIFDTPGKHFFKFNHGEDCTIRSDIGSILGSYNWEILVQFQVEHLPRKIQDALLGITVDGLESNGSSQKDDCVSILRRKREGLAFMLCHSDMIHGNVGEYSLTCTISNRTREWDQWNLVALKRQQNKFSLTVDGNECHALLVDLSPQQVSEDEWEVGVVPFGSDMVELSLNISASVTWARSPYAAASNNLIFRPELQSLREAAEAYAKVADADDAARILSTMALLDRGLPFVE